MPTFAAHTLFGDNVLKRLPQPLAQAVNRDGAAFHYGLFGPDVLFFSDTVWRKELSLNHLGVRMHQCQIREQFACLFDWIFSFRGRTDQESQAALSYTAGYLCHYRLDSVVHPYVYALCKNGSRIGADSHAIHNRIESDFDSLLWASQTGKAISAYRVRPAALREVINTARQAGAGLFQAIGTVYGIRVPPAAVSRAFGEMEFASRRMFSQGRLTAGLCAATDRLTHVGAGAFLRRTNPDPSVLNGAHREWSNPFTGERHSQSYAELEEEAARQAAADLAVLYMGRRVEPNKTFSGAPFEGGLPDSFS